MFAGVCPPGSGPFVSTTTVFRKLFLSRASLSSLAVTPRLITPATIGPPAPVLKYLLNSDLCPPTCLFPIPKLCFCFITLAASGSSLFSSGVFFSSKGHENCSSVFSCWFGGGFKPIIIPSFLPLAIAMIKVKPLRVIFQDLCISCYQEKTANSQIALGMYKAHGRIDV